jgi:hypothetical protein
VLSRRGFLLGSGAAVLLAACGDDDTDAGTDTGGGEEPALVLGEAFDRNELLVAGILQRAPIILFEETGGLVPLGDAPETISFTLRPSTEGEAVEVSTPRRGEDIERPYYPTITTFPASGEWIVAADLGNGQMLESLVIVNDEVRVPQVGDPLPVAATPTVAAPLGVTNICTQDPPCPLHETSLDAAVAAGRPVAVLLSTPEYCQVGICGPVLDLLVAEAGNRPELAFVHIEVYTEGSAGSTGPVSPLVSETFALHYEPALFVADATGTITARMDNIFDGPELAEALDTATS